MKLLSRTLLAAATTLAMLPAFAGPAFAAGPANDTAAHATVITSLPTTIVEDTTQATTDALDAKLNQDCGAPYTNASVWFKYTDSTGGGLVATMQNSDYSGGFMITEGDPSLGNLLACGPTTVGVNTTAGTTYYVVAFSDTEVNGGRLEVTFDEAPPLPEMTVSTSSRGVAYHDGSARVTGTYSCTNALGDQSEIDVNLTQRVGRLKVSGDGFVYPLECDGATHHWSAVVTSYNGLFRGGKAAAVTYGYACGQLECNNTYDERTIQLSNRR